MRGGWIAAVVLVEIAAGVGGGPAVPSVVAGLPELPAAPSFVSEFSGNRTAVTGSSVILNCRVRHIGETKEVSWGHGMRLLTAGLTVFVDDPRYQTLHAPNSEDWGLRISPVRRSDDGIYFCQISSTPPVSHELALRVVDPSVAIVGGPEIHIYRGGNATLTCVIRGEHRPDHVRWTHNNRLAEFDPTRSGIRVQTVHEESRTVSQFSIASARLSDSGQYFCDPDGLAQVKVTVHVLSADDPAAMQTTGGACSSIKQKQQTDLISLLWLGVAACWCIASRWCCQP